MRQTIKDLSIALVIVVAVLFAMAFVMDGLHIPAALRHDLAWFVMFSVGSIVFVGLAISLFRPRARRTV
jgi:hypothetical protein